jgi:hypothetical protein
MGPDRPTCGTAKVLALKIVVVTLDVVVVVVAVVTAVVVIKEVVVLGLVGAPVALDVVEIWLRQLSSSGALQEHTLFDVFTLVQSRQFESGCNCNMHSIATSPDGSDGTTPVSELDCSSSCVNNGGSAGIAPTSRFEKSRLSKSLKTISKRTNGNAVTHSDSNADNVSTRGMTPVRLFRNNNL